MCLAFSNVVNTANVAKTVNIANNVNIANTYRRNIRAL